MRLVHTVGRIADSHCTFIGREAELAYTLRTARTSYGDQGGRGSRYCRLQRACQQAAQNLGSTMQKNSLG
jgi:hypothetical protein